MGRCCPESAAHLLPLSSVSLLQALAAVHPRQHAGSGAQVVQRPAGAAVQGSSHLRKPLLPPELALLCPTRTVAFCMAAMWWAKGAVLLRLRTLTGSDLRDSLQVTSNSCC